MSNEQKQITVEQLEGMHAADTGNIVKMLGRKDDMISNLARGNQELGRELQSVKTELESIKSSIKSLENLISEKDKIISELENSKKAK